MKTLRQPLLAIAALMLGASASAQTPTAQPTAAQTPAAPTSYVFTGRIEYERKTNIHRQMEGEEYYEQFVSMVPKFHTTYFDLLFTSNRALYRPGREPENTNPFGAQMAGPASANVVYTDFAARRVTAEKAIFETRYLVEDSVRRLRWRVEDEVRTIAGYPCRKAVARMFDSVVVVAFYTDALPVSGGPEGFAGLPGMILEVAIPRLHTTWIATRVETTPPDASGMTAPTKGKRTTPAGLVATLQSSTKDWGKHAARSIWWTGL